MTEQEFRDRKEMERMADNRVAIALIVIVFVVYVIFALVTG